MFVLKKLEPMTPLSVVRSARPAGCCTKIRPSTALIARIAIFGHGSLRYLIARKSAQVVDIS